MRGDARRSGVSVGRSGAVPAILVMLLMVVGGGILLGGVGTRAGPPAPHDVPWKGAVGTVPAGSVMGRTDAPPVPLGSPGPADNPWVWLNVTRNVSPSARYGAAFAYDPAEGYFLLFGGCLWGCSQGMGDTWSFSNSTGWKEICSGDATPPVCASEPSPRGYAEMTYDPADGYMLLYGGYRNGVLNDTWKFESGRWTNLTVAGNPTPATESAYGFTMSYDPGRKEVALFTPDSGSEAVWFFSGGNWTEVSIPPPAAIGQWDLLFFGNGTGGINLLASATYGPNENSACPETSYSLEGSQWVEVNSSVANMGPNPACTDFPDSVDAATGSVVFYGGESLTLGTTPQNGTWQLHGGYYSNVTPLVGNPPAVSFGAFAYDPTGQYSILFGGTNFEAGTTSAQTWLLSSPLGVNASSNRSQLDLGQSVAISVSPVGGLGPYAFGYDGLPPGCLGAVASAVVRCSPTASGNYTVTVNVTDSMGREAQTTLSLRVYGALQGELVAPKSDPTTAGVPVTFRVSVSGGRAPITEQWELGNGETGNGTSVTAAYASNGSYAVTVWVNDSEGERWSATETEWVNYGLQVAVSIPSEGEVGYRQTFLASVTGGTPPYRIAWATGENTTFLGPTASATYAVPGEYSVTATVVDGSGAVTEAEGSLTIVPPLNVTWFVASEPAVAGAPVQFGELIEDGVRPVNLTWTFGDGGRGWGSNPSHLYAYAGTFIVTMTATDSLGVRVGENGTVSVAAASTTGPRPPPPVPPSTTPVPDPWTPWVLAAGVGAGCLGLAVAVVRYRRRP